jgi:hypothetical protein
LIGEDRRKRKIPSLGKANTPMGTGVKGNKKCLVSFQNEWPIAFRRAGREAEAGAWCGVVWG